MEEQTCSICGYSDGKWEERQGMKMRDDLPVCALCKADGWSNDPKEVADALLADPLLGGFVNHASPYQGL